MKGKIISLKTIKGSGSSSKMNKDVANDESFSPIEEEMAFFAQHFTKFFRNKKNPSSGFKRDTSRRKDSRFGKNN